MSQIHDVAKVFVSDLICFVASSTARCVMQLPQTSGTRLVACCQPSCASRAFDPEGSAFGNFQVLPSNKRFSDKLRYILAVRTSNSIVPIERPLFLDCVANIDFIPK